MTMPAPIRAAGYAAWFYGITTVLCVVGILVRIFAPERALQLAQSWAKLALRGLPICGIDVSVSGLDQLPGQGPLILAGQHQSAFDTLIWMCLLPRPAYVVKQELRRVPLFGPLLVPAGMIPLDRGGGAGALRSLARAAVDASSRDRQLVIFPEGTRVPFGQRARLQPGVAAIAARLGLPVYPVATDSGRCWPRGILTKRPGTIHIAVGPPIGPGRREELLAAIEAWWREQARSGFEPVDKSVEASAEIGRANARES